jgi:membrane protein
MALGRRDLWPLVKQTFSDWQEDNASRLAASLAFYTALSLAPLVMIVLSIAGVAFGEEAARGEILGQVDGLIGRQGAEAVQMVLTSADDTDRGVLATAIGVAVLLVGASGVFAELQSALDTIWDVKPRPGRGLRGIIKDRFFSFTMVVGVGFLLLVSLLVSAAISALGARFGGGLETWPAVLQAINVVLSFAVATVLFALIFKVVPDAKIHWSDVWIGALVTAALFTLGRYLIGMYLGRSAVGSAYGAAGSLIAVLVWVYYSAQILFLGAEFTQVYATRRGAGIEASADAVPIERPPDGTPARG